MKRKLIKRGSIKIPRGKVVIVKARGTTIKVKRYFTNMGKCVVFLNYCKKHHKGVRITIETKLLN